MISTNGRAARTRDAPTASSHLGYLNVILGIFGFVGLVAGAGAFLGR